jgi:hypothetical protein
MHVSKMVDSDSVIGIGIVELLPSPSGEGPGVRCFITLQEPGRG